MCRLFWSADPGGAQGEPEAGRRDHPAEPPASAAAELLLQNRGGQPHRWMRHLREVRQVWVVVLHD